MVGVSVGVRVFGWAVGVVVLAGGETCTGVLVVGRREVGCSIGASVGCVVVAGNTLFDGAAIVVGRIVVGGWGTNDGVVVGSIVGSTWRSVTVGEDVVLD